MTGQAPPSASPHDGELPQPTPHDIPLDEPSLHPEIPFDGCLPGHGLPRLWVNGEYLHWWIKSGPLPEPLVTTGPLATAGVLGADGTAILFGVNSLDYGSFNGARATVGWRLRREGSLAMEASGFFLNEETITLTQQSDAAGNPVLSRPIINAQTGAETAVVVAAPGSFVGSVDISTASRLWGAEANVRANLLAQGQTALDLLVGFRYLDLEESLGIATESELLTGGVTFFEGIPILAPGSLSIRDSFATRNRFYGGQIGAHGTVRRGRWVVDATGKVAFGGVRQLVQVNGSTTLVNAVGDTAVATGGVLALPTNIGSRARTDGAVVPEGTIRVGFHVTENVSLLVGYTILYWNNAARPGDQVVRTVNKTQLPTSSDFGPLTGPAQPAPVLNESKFWAQGFDFGLAFRY
jgi:hypothetical protein